MKTTLKTPILAGVCALLFSFGTWRTQPLSAVTKPYLGTYECARAYYGQTDVLKEFSYIQLELKDKETYVLSFCEKGSKQQEKVGRYAYDETKGTLTLYAEGGIQRSFPMEKGVLTVSVPILGKTLYLQFKQN